MSASQNPAIDELLLRWEEQTEGGHAPSLESLCADTPELLGELRARVDALQKINALLDTRAPASDTAPEAGGKSCFDAPATLTTAQEYDVQRQVATGGRAEIHLAYDERLTRHVAIKRLRDDVAKDDISRDRLRREARIIGSLDHPGIVPIYGTGTDAAGNPFYSMRLVAGGTLRDAITRFHILAAQTPDTQRSELFLLLRHYVDACQTIAYAHEQGIAHRDLKPENILVGDFGATFVVDWGLAKRWEDDTGDEDGRAGERRESASPALTQVGASLGTPAYMSPEQAHGTADEDLVAADVFNLGATLYTILTGRAPYGGQSLLGVIQQAKWCASPPPRAAASQATAGMDPALEAVCLKAMARDVDDRYATAAALAADIQRVMDDQPVNCYRDPFSRRALRWARRHRTLLSLISMVLVGTLLALAVGNVLIEGQRRRADANFKSAHEAVTDAFVRISNDALLKQPEFQQLRGELLSSSLGFYEQLLSENQDDPRVQFEMADSALRVGMLRAEMGRQAEALNMLRRADQLFEALRPSAPHDTTLRLRQALGLRMLALVEHQLDEGASLEPLHRARTLLEQGLMQHRGDDREDLLAEWVETLLAEGEILHGQGEISAALELSNIAEQRLQPEVDARFAPRLLEHVLVQRSQWLAEGADPVAALEAVERALVPAQDANGQPSDHPSHQRATAHLLDRAGTLLVKLDRHEEAVERFREGALLLERLVLQKPHVVDYREGYADLTEHLADSLHHLEQLSDSLTWLQKSMATRRAIGRGTDALQRKLAQRHYGLGLWHRDENRIHAAHENFVAAKRALDDIQRADPELSFELAKSLLFMGIDRWQMGLGEKALDAFQEAGEMLESLWRQHPDILVYRERLAAGLIGKAMALEMLERHREQITACQEAIRHLEALLAVDETATDAAIGFSMAHFVMGGGYQLTGDSSAAQQALQTARNSMPANTETLYEYARNYAQQAARFGKDKPAYSENDRYQMKRYVTESLYCLSQASALGTLDPHAIENDPAFLSLRGESAFRELIQGGR